MGNSCFKGFNSPKDNNFVSKSNKKEKKKKRNVGEGRKQRNIIAVKNGAPASYFITQNSLCSH